MSGIGDLFHEAVRCAQLIKLEEDPEGRYPPFEVEYRRRLWFHLCGLESRTAEEGGSRKYSILKGQTVQMPRNLNDCDLNPRMTTSPQSRFGVTDSTFPILRYDNFLISQTSRTTDCYTLIIDSRFMDWSLVSGISEAALLQTHLASQSTSNDSTTSPRKGLTGCT